MSAHGPSAGTLMSVSSGGSVTIGEEDRFGEMTAVAALLP